MATPANSFARVDVPDPRAVTVTIRQIGDATVGEVEGPASPAGAEGSALTFGQDGSLDAQQALAVGCQLANELGRDVVVIDQGGNWRPAWGRLEKA
jgi:hypothetical protein